MKSSGVPKSYRDLCRAFDTLPGIGEQGAQRLVEWLIYHGDVQAFSSNMTALQALSGVPCVIVWQKPLRKVAQIV